MQPTAGRVQTADGSSFSLIRLQDHDCIWWHVASLDARWKCAGYPAGQPPNASADTYRGCHQLLAWGSWPARHLPATVDHLDLRIRVDRVGNPGPLWCRPARSDPPRWHGGRLRQHDDWCMRWLLPPRATWLIRPAAATCRHCA